MKYIFIATCSLLFSCKDRPQQVSLEKINADDTLAAVSQIFTDRPTILDTSGMVLYPLIFENGDDYKFGSSGGGRSTYWNILFYDTKTAHQHLLVTGKKVLFRSITEHSSSSEWETNQYDAYKDYIMYTGVTLDYNGDKQLNDKDPAYLFLSDREGNHFRQLSPDGYDITGWDVVPSTSKIIMQAQRDVNGDKKFDRDDPVIPLIADWRQEAKGQEILSPAILQSLQQELLQSWKGVK